MGRYIIEDGVRKVEWRCSHCRHTWYAVETEVRGCPICKAGMCGCESCRAAETRAVLEATGLTGVATSRSVTKA